MTNFPDDAACPNCGGALEVRHRGSTQGLYCTKCDWSVVTSRLPEILIDQTKYKVTVTSGDFRNGQHLETIAKLLGRNRLDARKLLQSSADFFVFGGTAYETAKARDSVEAAGLGFRIDPPFPW